MHISLAIEKFFTQRNVRNLQEKTLRWYRMWLSHWQRWLEDNGRTDQVADMSVDDLREFLLYLRTEHIAYQDHDNHPNGDKLSEQSILGAWQVLSGLWRFLENDKVLSAEQCDFFPDRVPRPKVEQAVRPTYSDDSIDRLLDACANTDPELEARNRAIILLLVESGMRVGELCQLRIEHIDFTMRQARIRGKGGKWRHVFWGPTTAEELEHYAPYRTHEREGIFFMSGNAHKGNPITYNTVLLLFRRLAERSGVKLPLGAPIHALRHTFAHKVLHAGIDGLHLQQLMGHADMQTTSRYVREYPDQLRAIHNRVFNK
jgi:site-specific recombinase XerD